MKKSFFLILLVVFIFVTSVVSADYICSVGSFGVFSYTREIWPKEACPEGAKIIGTIEIIPPDISCREVPAVMVYLTENSQVKIETEVYVNLPQEKVLYEGKWGVKAEEILRGKKVTAILNVKLAGEGEGQKDILIKGYFLISKL